MLVYCMYYFVFFMLINILYIFNLILIMHYLFIVIGLKFQYLFFISFDQYSDGIVMVKYVHLQENYLF